tara:strand:- start:2414 stop:4057 length:1644 start_codon:yes stop_codon:yes gene_type:complete
MGGGLMQLVAYGAQDIYLTGNPQITFFKVVYRRHTNFSMEHIEQTINGTPQWGKDVQSTISRTGDLLHKMNIEWTKPSPNTSPTDTRIPHNMGHYMIKHITLTIGGTEIDRIFGHWMEVHSRLTIPNPSKIIGAYSKEMINTISDPPPTGTPPDSEFKYSISNDLANNIHQNTHFQQMTGAGGVEGQALSDGKNEGELPRILQIPIPFYFCKNPGLAIPLIALQYHDVSVKIKMIDNQAHTYYDNNGNINSGGKTFNKEIFGGGDGTMGSMGSLKLLCEYIYLDTEERRRFAQVTHEYLIEQVQREEHNVNNSSTINSFKLHFNHPVKELIFCGDWGYNKDVTNMWPDLKANDVCGVSSSDASNYIKDASPGWLPGIGNHDTTVTLKLNNHDRFSADKPLYYFTRLQPHNYHSGPVQLYSYNPQIVGGEGHYQSGGCGHTMENNELNRIQDSIGVYSFALKPEEHQPSGSCNFSRIDNCVLKFKNLHLNPSNDDIKQFCMRHDGHVQSVYADEKYSNLPTSSIMIVYAVNYNVLRIMSGMGGLAYSN